MKNGATSPQGRAATLIRSIYLALLLLFLAGLLAGCGSDGSVPPTPTAEPALVRTKTSFAITRDGATLTIPVYVSQPLTSPDLRVTRAVVAIHGISRNAVATGTMLRPRLRA